MTYCPVQGCFRQLLVGHAFCSAHWFRVPLAMRSRINALYRNPRTRGGPSHLRAMNEAKALLAVQVVLPISEGRHL